MPYRLSRWLGRAEWACDLTDAVHIGVAPRGVLPWPARLERRFGVIHDGVLDVFEVANVDTVVAAVRAALAAAP
jgi:hypothetical protein